MALVIVLFTLLIVSALVVSFLTAVQLETRASASYQATAATQQLSDTAVNMVLAEISAATSQQAPNIWASQPGAIWVFDGTGTPKTIYRLYSWPSTTATSGTSLLGDASQMANWATAPALWVDLNAESASGKYPIIDPGSNPNALVDGFSTNSVPSSGTSATPSLPMPVQWLYVLQNGAVVAPTKIDNNTVMVSGGSASNPIVGRIAYWTDDETCKVNVNTAGGDDGGAAPTVSGGTVGTSFYANNAGATFWDVPHFNSSDDLSLATNQAVQGEYQRYPGHPASTALSYLLSSLMGSTLSSANFYSLTPRYAFGGSQGGTVGISSGEMNIPLKSDRLYTSVDDMLFSSSNRAASTINSQSANCSAAMQRSRFFLTAHSVAPELNLRGEPRVSMWPIWDETPGNGNWISSAAAWTNTAPVPSGDAKHMTAFDQTLSFCSTLVSGGYAYPYYFTRANNTNVVAGTDPINGGNGQGTPDVLIARNQKLLGYLDAMLTNAVPGFGGTFSAPGTSSKWNANVDAQLETRQVLTEMFDYVRTINSLDPNLPQVVTGGATYPNNVYAAGTPSSGNVLWQGISVGAGQVAPTEISGYTKVNGTAWGTQGYGSLPLLTEADLHFVAIGQNTNLVTGAAPAPVFSDQIGYRGDPSAGPTYTSTGMLTSNVNLPPTNSVAVQAYLLLNFVNPNHWTPWAHAEPVFFVDVSGLNGLYLNGYPLFSIPNNQDCAVAGGIKYDALASAQWGAFDFRGMVADRVLGPGYDNAASSGLGNYPFYSNIVGVTNTPTMSVGSNPAVTNALFVPLTIKIYQPLNTSYLTVSTGLQRGDLVQTYTVNVPNATITTPSLALFRRIGTPGGNGNGGTNGGPQSISGGTTATVNSDRWRDIFADGAGGQAWEMATYFQSGNNVSHILAGSWPGQDVVQGMVLAPAWSDARMLAISNVPSSAFITAPGYGNGLTNLAYGIRAFGMPLPGPSFGTLTKNASYSAWPLASPSINGATTTGGVTGDWDNGTMSYPDGPYINKTDEGNQETGQGVAYYQWNQMFTSTNGVYFSPNRQVPSPVMLGSLPTGVDPSGNHPAGWQTLLFRPGPAGHPGSTVPEDELLLDLFWMPVTDPYPMSESFATLGKVNLNYEIVPFTYINRSTALRAVLSSEKVAAVPFNKASTYKVEWSSSNNLGGAARLSLNLGSDTGSDGGTLQQFRDMFTGAGSFFSGTPMIFRSAAQICDVFLVPQGYSWTSGSAAQAAWYGTAFAMVGDNERERPYADIYGRVTTKSNCFKVHYTVQSLKPAPGDMTATTCQWNETRGAITGQYSGSTVIERYIDPTASGIPDYAVQPQPLPSSVPNLESFYRWRVVEQHQFVP